MIQPIQVNVLQSYVDYLTSQHYRTVGSGLNTITLPTPFKPQSTMIFINEVYQPFSSYIEGSDNVTIFFNTTVSSGQEIDVQYYLLGT